MILALTVAEGATVPVGAPIALIGASGEELADAGSEAVVAASASVGAPQQAREPAPSAAPPAPPQINAAAPRFRSGRSTPGVAARPPARRRAERRPVDTHWLRAERRVIRADVERAAAGAHAIGSANGGAAAPSPPAEPAPAKGTSTVNELTRRQQTVARRMAQSRATIPDIELRVEVDMGEAVALRERLRDVTDPVPSFNDFVVKAAALALREFPG